MTIVASGEITSQDIATELNETGEHDLTAFAALAAGDATITAEPHDITDWYGYTHTFAPNAPTAVSNVFNGATLKIDLVWTEGAVDATHSNEDSYRIEEMINTGSGFGPWGGIANSGQDTTSTSFVSFGTSGDLVRVRIRAENIGGVSAYSVFPSTILIP